MARKDDPLPLEAVMPHHRAAWRVERVGWAVMAFALLGALLGVFGDGPLSQASEGSATALKIEYDRFQRSGAPQIYRFTVHPSISREGSVELRLDQSLIEDMELDSIVPEPQSMRSASGHTSFIFAVAPAREPLLIKFRFRPATFGHRSGRINAEGAPPLNIDHYIYP